MMLPLWLFALSPIADANTTNIPSCSAKSRPKSRTRRCRRGAPRLGEVHRGRCPSRAADITRPPPPSLRRAPESRTCFVSYGILVLPVLLRRWAAGVPPPAGQWSCAVGGTLEHTSHNRDSKAQQQRRERGNETRLFSCGEQKQLPRRRRRSSSVASPSRTDQQVRTLSACRSLFYSGRLGTRRSRSPHGRRPTKRLVKRGQTTRRQEVPSDIAAGHALPDSLPAQLAAQLKLSTETDSVSSIFPGRSGPRRRLPASVRHLD